MTHLPKFCISFLHPRYWFTWVGIGLLWCIVQLPYSVIYRLGCGLGFFALHIMKRRFKIAKRNLELCFPKMSDKDREVMLIKNFESVGMGIMETGMAWFWLNNRIKRWMEITGIGIEPIKALLKKKYGVILVGIHFLTLEVGARMLGIYTPGIGVYRPNNNPVLNWIQTWGRLRSNKSMLDRKDFRGIVRALKNGEIIWYAPDHDYGPKSSVFVPFFAVKQAATTTGIWMLIKSAKVAIVPFVPRRKPNGRGYELIVLEPELPSALEDAKTTAIWINRIIEKCIMLAPEQYMWFHRRFKTRPQNGISSPSNIRKR